ncbi:MAG TPA: lysylphosphatidylglycerol synthase domain-containing protein, partial [Planctomycetota bacterium]|nr:lysylphosphatidylglycerol synthase domain-containing protein [Planctomycetota bacterium]
MTVPHVDPRAARRRKLKFAVKAALTIVVLAAVVRAVGGNKLRAALARLTPGDWLFGLGAFLAVHALGVLKWRAWILLAGGRLRPGDAFRAYAAGLFSNLFLPSMIGGDVLRAGLAMQATKQKEAVVLGGLTDRLSDFVGLAMLAGAGLLALPHALAESGGSADVGRRILVAFGVAAALGVLLLVALARLRPPATWPPKVRRLRIRVALALRKLSGRRLALVGLVLGAAAL